MSAVLNTLAQVAVGTYYTVGFVLAFRLYARTVRANTLWRTGTFNTGDLMFLLVFGSGFAFVLGGFYLPYVAVRKLGRRWGVDKVTPDSIARTLGGEDAEMKAKRLQRQAEKAEHERLAELEVVTAELRREQRRTEDLRRQVDRWASSMDVDD
jgi:hypothetical protein